MADQASKDEAAKARIISHMNADHHDSVGTFDLCNISLRS